MYFSTSKYRFSTLLNATRFCIIPLAFLVFCCLQTIAQSCPPNIDFESGTFNGWTCYIGNTTALNNQNQINLTPSGPISDRHLIYASNSGLTDPFGNFSVNCPNGSGYSVKLGNTTGGGEAEGMSYEFTIPANKTEYSLIYHYAVVFEDPRHEQFQQPRMQVEITNVTDGNVIDCSSFTFIPFGTLLPGFYESPQRGDDGTAVWCKDWSAVSINLDGLAGKTIRLFFKTSDCTFRRHFGYAYIDVNSECSSEFVGAAYCPDDTAVTVTAPYGYQAYNWYNNNFTQLLGTQQSIRFGTLPVAGTTVAVEVIPFNGYGCIDTLYAKLVDTLKISAFAGKDDLFCGDVPIQIGTIPKNGLVYNWSPGLGLSDSAIANPLAFPLLNTTYILSVRNNGGGCLNKDTVLINSASLNNTIKLLGKAAYCLGNGDSAVLMVSPADSIQWFKDGQVIKGANGIRYRATKSGTYYAEMFSAVGCAIITKKVVVTIESPLPGLRYPDQYALAELPFNLQARSFGSVYSWLPGTSLSDAMVGKPVFRGPVDQSYTITIKTPIGCTTVDTVTVKIVPHADILVPTAFTPNSDGRNDVLRPVMMGIKELRYFRIYNRWGQLLYETKELNSGWDGRLHGAPQPTAVVVWVAEGLGVDGRLYNKKGSTVLIR